MLCIPVPVVDLLKISINRKNKLIGVDELGVLKKDVISRIPKLDILVNTTYVLIIPFINPIDLSLV